MRFTNTIKGFFLLFLAHTFLSNYTSAQELKKGTIDRREVVQRHRIKVTNLNEPGPSQVGNGNFAFGFDITGMQTINPKFATMSSWGWHSTLPPADPASFERTSKLTGNRMVPYDLQNSSQPALSRWLEGNPHKFNLGRIALFLKNDREISITSQNISDAVQYVDLWSGVSESIYKINGQPVKVTTIGDPLIDAVAFRVESPLVEQGVLGVSIEFPYADIESVGNGANFNSVAQHTTRQTIIRPGLSLFDRTLDSTTYQVAFSWSGKGDFNLSKPHRYTFLPKKGMPYVDYVYSFSPHKVKLNLPDFAMVKKSSEKYWPSFWQSGGAVDFSESTDKRWFELERRVVLSQYLVKINSSGKYPPQETGLVANSWYGRFHYEMIWWNQAHFGLWNRWSLWRDGLNVYSDNLESSKKRAEMQGYKGARYPKCTGPDGREWPHPIHAYLVWQQPHPIFFADMDYRAHPTKSTLKKWEAIVENSADFLSSYVQYDSVQKKYFLGTPISAVPENNDYYKDKNPIFELAYFKYGLKTAQQQRVKLGLPEKEEWNKVYDNLVAFPQKNGMYEQWENVNDMWGKFNYEHPALLGIFGMLPGQGVDSAVMIKTYEKVRETWKFNSCWGWDFPLIAMTAARIGRPGDAVDMLLYESRENSFDTHAMNAEGKAYYPYMPANGGLLYAIAMMCAGWDNGTKAENPGFPKDGSWVVKWEGLSKAP